MGEERIDFAQCLRPVPHASGIPLYKQVGQQVEDAWHRAQNARGGVWAD